VRELRNLVESMVVLSHGREILSEDLPRQIREGGSARFLPVHVGPVARTENAVREDGRELEFILRSLLELRLQVEELRRRLDEPVTDTLGDGFIGEVLPDGAKPRLPRPAPRIGPRNETPPNTVIVEPGMKMTDIERRVIEATLRETRGNRRRAAEILGIGERTLYRKIREYELPVS
jgi:DNA-binding NtrC family response regulator